jgi:hypothetical protein
MNGLRKSGIYIQWDFTLPNPLLKKITHYNVTFVMVNLIIRGIENYVYISNVFSVLFNVIIL